MACRISLWWWATLVFHKEDKLSVKSLMGFRPSVWGPKLWDLKLVVLPPCVHCRRCSSHTPVKSPWLIAMQQWEGRLSQSTSHFSCMSFLDSSILLTLFLASFMFLSERGARTYQKSIWKEGRIDKYKEIICTHGDGQNNRLPILAPPTYCS